MAELLKELECLLSRQDITLQQCFVNRHSQYRLTARIECAQLGTSDLMEALLGTVFGNLCNCLHSSDPS